MQIGSGVGFGKQCKSGGLKAPKKVGSSGNLSDVNISDNKSASARGRQGLSKGVLVGIVDGIFVLLVILLGMIAVFVAAIVGTIGGLAALLDGD